MATDIKTNWMQDFNGDLFAPKTLVESIQNKEGTPLEELLGQSGGTTGADLLISNKLPKTVNDVSTGIIDVQSTELIANIKTDWLEDKENNLFSPRILMDSIQDNDGTTLKDYINKTILNYISGNIGESTIYKVFKGTGVGTGGEFTIDN